MTVQVAKEQVLSGSSATVSVEFDDQNGEPVDATGAVTVTATRFDGTALLTNHSTTHGTTGIYTVTLTPAQTQTLDYLTLVWTDAGTTATKTTTVEVVGGYYFSLSHLRSSYSSFFGDKDTYPDEQLIKVRREVETECERITGVAFVPRFRVLTLWGGGQDYIDVPNRMLRTLRAMNFGSVALGAQALTNTVITADGRVQRYWPFASNATDDSWAQWGQRFPYKTRVTVAYEHGYERPPEDLKNAALLRMKYRLTEPDLPMPANATSYTDSTSGSFSIGKPDAMLTGIDAIDAVYLSYRVSQGDVMSVPISSGLPPQPVSY